MRANGQSRRRRAACLLPVFAWLTIQLVMSFGIVVSGPASAGPAGPLTWVCTPAGPRLIDLDGAPAAADDAHAACFWCQAFGAAAVPVFGPTPETPFTPAAGGASLADDAEAVRARRAAAFQSRAPPRTWSES